MKSPVTVDASVFVNAFSPDEEGSETSMAFLSQLSEAGAVLIEPTLLLSEVAASLAHKQDNSNAALELERELKNFLNITLVDLDEDLADFASEVATKYRLRGSDAVYAAVALRFETQLITLDKEHLERLKEVLSVATP